MKRIIKSSAPAVSNMSVPRTMRFKRVFIPLKLPPEESSIKTLRVLKLIVCRNTRKAVETSVIKPSPLIWIRNRITNCPNSDQCVAVSYGASPVSDTADAAVNSELIYVVFCPSLVAKGRIKSTLPKIIPNRYDSASICQTDSFRLLVFIII